MRPMRTDDRGKPWWFPLSSGVGGAVDSATILGRRSFRDLTAVPSRFAHEQEGLPRMMPALDPGALLPVCGELRDPIRAWISTTCAEEVPPLLYSDVAGLALLRTEIVLQERLSSTSPRRPEFSGLRRDALFVLWTVVPTLLEYGAFWLPGEPDPTEVHAFAEAAIRNWDAEILGLIAARLRRETWQRGSREDRLWALYVEGNRSGFVSDAQLLRQGAIGIRTRGGPSHSGDDSTPSAVAAELKAQWVLGNESRIFAVGSDGLLRVDVRGLRDQGRSSKRLRKTELMDDLESGTGALLASGAANDARAAVDAVQEADDARKLREVIAVRLAELQPQTTAWHCVTHAEALLDRIRSVAAVAREVGASPRAMQKAWRAESQILLDRFRVSLRA